ncbi:molybdopterin/thiamine biosynthesis adenylyltransferase [Cytobacillus oceanisediminis]|uniref:Molybdopterin/thiamine biosynthesis adenylyltransferase n=1 Tax=Cytobacillus oceanisediminis TaxID=665099 RepID=A0A2V3A2P2_9BACI|nr:MoeB/ThiF family adenylyltransferase [Cytobacillus oceanisediminis]PWW29025.1 molybdopterin/thiamine biosynthesis adenylyltransferase [Cytobacillus oceanisediminis]
MNVRYSRQILFPPIGKEGQKKLGEKHVLIVGAGALGAANAETLARAGVGKITIADRDYVEWSNLQRQQLYCEEDADQKTPKAIAAANRLKAINSEVQIIPRIMDVGVQELEELIEGADLIIDSTDNFEIRFLINDVSQKHRIPWIYGGCVGSYGLSYTILPGVSPCLQCLMDKLPLGGITCDTAGVIQPAIQMVVSHQSAEALKILTEDFESLRGTLVSFDIWKNHYSSINVSSLKNPECSSCGSSRAYPFLSYENQTKTALLCGRDTVQIRPSALQNIDFSYLEKVLVSQGIKVESNPYLLSFSIGEKRLVVFKDGRVLVHGVKDVLQAKNLYHRYLG